VPSADPKLLSQLDDFFVHGRHPSGRLIAAEALDVLRGECCVWDLETGELVWRPKAHSIAWSGDGEKVALLVGEYGDELELRSWPDRELVSRSFVKPWACCNEYVALSPRGDRAAVLWWHQTEGGVNLVAFEEAAARQLAAYETKETNLLQGPTFSPDGKFVAISEGFVWWWLPDDAENPEVECSLGGSFRRGRLTLLEVDSGSVHHFDAVGEVEAGWQPPHDGWEHFELLGKPRFVSNDEIELEPEFGEPCRFLRPGSGGR
jgi:hypothetical protein